MLSGYEEFQLQKIIKNTSIKGILTTNKSKTFSLNKHLPETKENFKLILELYFNDKYA